MHVITEFYDQRDSGLRPQNRTDTRALGHVGLPCMLTTITTSAGFLAFVVTPHCRPYREMGVVAATGTVAALRHHLPARPGGVLVGARPTRSPSPGRRPSGLPRVA